jgi:hypothetical protein
MVLKPLPEGKERNRWIAKRNPTVFELIEIKEDINKQGLCADGLPFGKVGMGRTLKR